MEDFMTQQPPEDVVWCIICEAVIPKARLEAVPETRICVVCQTKVEKGVIHLDDWLIQKKDQPVEEETEVAPIQVHDNRLVAGAWSGGFMEVATQNGHLRRLLQEGKKDEARALVQSLPKEAQAALVWLDENPEEALSITGMDASGKPNYSVEVVSLLPTEMLAGLVAYDPEEKRFNTHLIQAMTPGTFRRTVDETLEPMDNAEARASVTWEWLEALAELNDVNKRCQLLRSVDAELLEEALIIQVKQFDMTRTMGSAETGGDDYDVPLCRLFSEDSAVGIVPSMLCEDPAVGRVLDALFDADDALMRAMSRGAWERQFDGWEEL
jgi:hypothetical protein